MRTLTAALFTAALSFTSTQALAQDFSSKGDFAVSADRLFAFHFGHRSFENGGDVDASSMELGWGGNGLTPFDVPRVALDFFVIDHLSIGGALGFASRSGDLDGSEFLFAPRVGYVWNMADWASFWLRGGFTYHSASQPDEDGLALTVEPTFVFTPVQHVGFLAGFTLDQDLFGSTEVGAGPGTQDHKYRDIAIIQAGMLVWF